MFKVKIHIPLMVLLLTSQAWSYALVPIRSRKIDTARVKLSFLYSLTSAEGDSLMSLRREWFFLTDLFCRKENKIVITSVP